jgi:hypothetical protein
VRSPQADWAFPGQAWVHCSLCPGLARVLVVGGEHGGGWASVSAPVRAPCRAWCVAGRSFTPRSSLRSLALVTVLLLPAAASSESVAEMLPVLAKAESRMRLQRCETPLLPGPWVARLTRRVCSAPILNDYRRVHTTAPLSPKQRVYSSACCAFLQQQSSYVVCIARGHSGRLTLAASRSQRAAQARRWRRDGEVRPASRASLVCSA